MEFYDENETLNFIASKFFNLFLESECLDITVSLNILEKQAIFVLVTNSLDDSLRHFLLRLIKKENISEREYNKYESYICLRDLLNDIKMETTDENTTIEVIRKYE